MYTLRWLGLHCLFALAAAFFLAMLSIGIDNIALDRVHAGLLTESYRDLVTDCTAYTFATIAITLVAVMLVEVAFRKPVNYVQYGLMALALTLFNLLLLAMAEHMPFVLAYIIVSVMTIALISVFVKALMKIKSALWFTAGLLVVEYGLIFMLVNLGSMALLVGSLILFLLIALAMYFSIKLRIENEELIIK